MNSIKPLLYFSLFNYPLSAKEVYLFSCADDQNEISHELDYLTKNGMIGYKKGFYYLNDDKTISRRIKGNKMAKEVMNKAIKKALFISKFPYIEAVGISGSLSKNYYDKDSDFDFFIITKTGRLWISRTLLMLYKKIFLLNSKKFFCIGYFITKKGLEIEEKNLFTAIELNTLIPVCGDFKEFYAQNTWVLDYLPNSVLEKESIATKKDAFFSKFIMFLLQNKAGDLLDKLLLKLTLKKWNAKFSYLNKKDFKVAMKSTTNVSKHHPENFQKKVINRLNDSYDRFQSKHNIVLEKENA